MGVLHGGYHLRRIRAGLWLASIGPLVPRPCVGQLPPGQLAERVVSTSDTSQAYALYLPPGYAATRRWPILFVLDPRGRALLALRLFQDAAARLGWIVMSSYNTLSDGPPEPNLKAMDAMLLAAQDSLSIDLSRLYLAGFSGTARAALKFAVPLRGHVAGVIAAGGALGFELGGPETVFARDSGFAYFGAAGSRDFNYEEVLAMGERFGTMFVPYRVVVFEGPHSWPSADICGEAMEWLELRAMESGRRGMDSAWVKARLQRELARSAELERRGQWDQALRLNEAIARDYPHWPGTDAAAARASALRKSPEVKHYRKGARHWADQDLKQAAELQKILAWARSQRESPQAATVAKKLKIPQLQEAAGQRDSLKAASASRLLARIFAWLSFYEPRTYLQGRSPSRALTMFEAAIRIAPIQGEGCALLRAALPAATPEQQTRLKGQCARN